ncbi:MAG: mechanosensitive ion channel [Treponema sp.]|jgi:small conductance mechanosensitive channel|nr:mechanosensitive ion channel [Treponema sp.]
MRQYILDLWKTHSTVILPLAKNIAVMTVILILGISVSKGARKLIQKASAKWPQSDGTAVPLLQTIVHYGIVIICIIMILNIFGVSTASLIAVIGAAGVAVGLALKDTLGNIASGIALLLLGTFRKGEYIEFGSFNGTVKEINLFTTILETPDGIYISAPNSSIWGSPLKNYTRNGKRRMELSVGIAYSDSVDTAFQVMQGIIDAEARFLKAPAPQVILQSLDDNSVKITIRAWAAIQDYWNIYWDMIKNIKIKIEKAGLHIPFPQRDVHIIQEQAL